MPSLLSVAKNVSGLGAIIIFVVGLVMTGITIYGFTHSELFLGDTSQRNIILTVMILADLILLGAAVLGIFGIKKHKTIFICVFQIFVIVFTITFFSLGIAAEVLPGQFFTGNCSSSDNPTIQLANIVSITSVELCSKNCPCALYNSTFNEKYSDFERGLMKGLNRSDSGALQTQQCGFFRVLTDDQKRMAQALGDIEQSLQCTGWCNYDINIANPFRYYYKFSNVNNGMPEGYCYAMLKDTVNSYSNVIGVGSIIVSLILLFVALINIFLCFHPDRKNLSLKERFTYLPEVRYRRLV